MQVGGAGYLFSANGSRFTFFFICAFHLCLFVVDIFSFSVSSVRFGG